MTYKYKHGLVIMRAQPFHIGHEKIINQMLKECEKATVLLGSIQEHGTTKNPFNYTTRKKMIQNIYRNTEDYPRLKIMGIYDINNPVEWADYVFDFLNESIPEWGRPDVYYAGSTYDAHWFKNAVNNFEYVSRTDPTFPFVSASMIRDMLKFGDNRWENFIHPANRDLIFNHFNKPQGVI